SSAICTSRPSRAKRSSSAGSSLLVVGIDQNSDVVLVAAPGIIPPQITIDGDRNRKRRGEIQSVMGGIVMGSDRESSRYSSSQISWPPRPSSHIIHCLCLPAFEFS